MNLIRPKALLLMLVFAIPPARAQVQSQPWVAPGGAVESRIDVCSMNPQPLSRIAMDDFQIATTTKIRMVHWWGIVNDVNQLTKPFYVAIWGNQQNGPCAPDPCNPTTILQYWCVTPSTTYVNLDCVGRRVYRFSACLSPSFTANASVKYWLQVSEIDSQSANPGAEDFRWSGFYWQGESDHTRLCSAQQRETGGIVHCAVLDDCNPPQTTDLSYELYSLCLSTSFPPGLHLPISGIIEVRPSCCPIGPPMAVEPVNYNDDHQLLLRTDLPDGDYQLTFIGMGMARPRSTLLIQNGEGSANFTNIVIGDLNNDGLADGLDISVFLGGLLHP